MTENQSKALSYLNSIREKVKEHKSIELEIEALEYAASGMGAIRYDKEHVDGGSGSDRLIEFISDALIKQADAERMSHEVDNLKLNCYKIIKQLHDTDERLYLEWYYINAIPMNDVINKINVSQRKAYYIREDALEHFGELMQVCSPVQLNAVNNL